MFCIDDFVDVHTTTYVNFPPSHISGRLVDLLAPSVMGAYHVTPCARYHPYQW